MSNRCVFFVQHPLFSPTLNAAQDIYLLQSITSHLLCHILCTLCLQEAMDLLFLNKVGQDAVLRLVFHQKRHVRVEEHSLIAGALVRLNVPNMYLAGDPEVGTVQLQNQCKKSNISSIDRFASPFISFFLSFSVRLCVYVYVLTLTVGQLV